MNSKILFCAAVLGVVPAIVIQAATTVGIDTTTDANWRTAAALEADNEYGTDGYLIYGIDVADGIYVAPYDFASDQTVLPTGITGIAPPADINMWSGNGNFGQMEDPANGNALTSTSLLASTAVNPKEHIISRIAGTSFQLTILVAEGDASGTFYATTVDDGSGPVSLVGSPHAANGLQYHVYDVPAGSGDVKVAAGADNGNFGATGFAFDSVVVPEPSSLALISLVLCGFGLCGRRR